MRLFAFVGMILVCGELLYASKGPCDGLPREVPKLLSILKDKESKLWHRAAICLGSKKLTNSEAQEAVSLLITFLRDKDKRRTSATALRGLQTFAVPELTKLLKDRDAEIRLWAAITLEEIGPGSKQAIHSLIDALEDHDRSVRARAALALGNIGDSTVVPRLIEFAADKNESEWTRVSSIVALGRLKDPRSESALIGLLDERAWPIRHYAVVAIGELGTRSKLAGPILYRLMSEPDSTLRTRCIRALGQIRYEPAFPRFMELATDPDSTIRGFAAEALGESRVKKAVPLLKEMLSDKNQECRIKASHALQRIDEVGREQSSVLGSPRSKTASGL